MNEVIYRMSKEMYYNLKYPLRYVKGKIKRSDKPLKEKEILQEVNNLYGLIRKVNKIEVI